MVIPCGPSWRTEQNLRFTLYSCFAGRSSPSWKKNGPTAFFPRFAGPVCPWCNWSICSSVAILPFQRKWLHGRCSVRLCHGISPEFSSSRHIFLKNAASANIILRFELSHKSGSNLFQNLPDSIDKKGPADYVLQHRMRTACVLFSPFLTHPFSSVSANRKERVVYNINSIASTRMAYSCRETITGKVHTALCRM